MELINSYGERYNDISKQEIIEAIKRWGSVNKAAERLGISSPSIHNAINSKHYEHYLRKPAVITSEFNGYVTRAW